MIRPSLPWLAFFVLPALPGQDLAFQSAADYSKEHAGLAVLVYHKDKLVFEEYQKLSAA